MRWNVYINKLSGSGPNLKSKSCFKALKLSFGNMYVNASILSRPGFEALRGGVLISFRFAVCNLLAMIRAEP